MLSTRTEARSPKQNSSISESLEQRVVWSGSEQVPAAIESFRRLPSIVGASTLSVVGTNADDVIRVVDIGSKEFDVELNGVVTRYHRSIYDRVCIDGSGGNDIVRNESSVPATLIGGDGDDRLSAGRASDLIEPGVGSDVITAGKLDIVSYRSLTPGQFFFACLEDVQYINYGGDSDQVSHDSGVTIELTEGDDVAQGEIFDGVTLRGGDGDDTLFLFERIDQPAFPTCVDGGPGNDTLRAGWYEDVFPVDSVWGGDGNDVIFGNAAGAPDGIDGGSGFDLQTEPGGVSLPSISPTVGFRVGKNVERLSVRVVGDTGLLVFGNDTGCTIDCFASQATVYAGPGNDVIRAAGGRALILGGGGNDLVAGGTFNDTLIGGDGNDTLIGGAGNDRLDGGAGNDRLAGEGGNDTLNGNSGNDNLHGGSGDDRLFGGTGNDTIDGGGGRDLLDGQAGNDLLYARDGQRDTLFGGSGSDRARRDNTAAVRDVVDGIEVFI